MGPLCLSTAVAGFGGGGWLGNSFVGGEHRHRTRWLRAELLEQRNLFLWE